MLAQEISVNRIQGDGLFLKVDFKYKAKNLKKSLDDTLDLTQSLSLYICLELRPTGV